MNKKVMIDLLDKGQDGHSILQILDALCDGMGDSAGGETPDNMNDLVESQETQKDLVEV